MMDVLKSYAHQVAAYHPQKVRNELFAEVYDELCEEFADWSRVHPGSDQAGFLEARKQHPMRYAAHLASEEQLYLVGPQFYFSFISTLKAAAAISVGVYLLLAIVTALTTGHWWRSVAQMALAWPQTMLWVSASILGVFVALEKSGERATWLDRWKASDLKPLESHQAVSRGEIYFDLGTSALLLLWISGIVSFPSVIRHDNMLIEGWVLNLPGASLGLAVALALFDAAYALVRLKRAYWSVRLRWISIIGNLAWIALLTWVALHGPVLSLPEPLASEVPAALAFVNRVVSGVLAVVCVVLAFEVLEHGWRLYRERQAHGMR